MLESTHSTVDGAYPLSDRVAVQGAHAVSYQRLSFALRQFVTVPSVWMSEHESRKKIDVQRRGYDVVTRDVESVAGWLESRRRRV